jgi:hypothetical protein
LVFGPSDESRAVARKARATVSDEGVDEQTGVGCGDHLSEDGLCDEPQGSHHRATTFLRERSRERIIHQRYCAVDIGPRKGRSFSDIPTVVIDPKPREVLAQHAQLDEAVDRYGLEPPSTPYLSKPSVLGHAGVDLFQHCTTYDTSSPCRELLQYLELTCTRERAQHRAVDGHRERHALRDGLE